MVLTYGNGVRMLLLELAGRDRSVYLCLFCNAQDTSASPILHLSLRSFPIPNVGRAGVEKTLSKWKGILVQKSDEQMPTKKPVSQVFVAPLSQV